MKRNPKYVCELCGRIKRLIRAGDHAFWSCDCREGKLTLADLIKALTSAPEMPLVITEGQKKPDAPSKRGPA